MSIQVAEFPLFPNLPLELRRTIWRLCLPRRIVEIDWPDNRTGLIRCDMRRGSRLNTRYPIITRVCRESRTIAFENGHIMEKDRDPRTASWQPWSFFPDRWFDPTTDIIHMNWNGFPDASSEQVESDRLPFFLWKTRKAKHASITVNFLGGFKHRTFFGWMNTKYDLAEHHKIYLVTLEIINLHVSRSDAIDSGLFGRLGEEHVKLVDVFDRETISKYHELWLSPGQEDRLSEKFFRRAFSTSGVHNWIDDWREGLEANWLSWKVTRLKNMDHIKHPTLELWYRREDTDIRNSNIRMVPNKDHPWVKQVIEGMPKFCPVVMFRLCSVKCFEKFPRPRNWIIKR
ncbi:hypothetical protein F5884DRAFT_58522 [Xylogone sp. PMI_703]|nr:hypothetical protein F5884DRAFT_58522 [Xylogone sp. PMI_703]